MRKGTLPVIAGKPPAAPAQPSVMKGMMVTVATNDAQEPSAHHHKNLVDSLRRRALDATSHRMKKKRMSNELSRMPSWLAGRVRGGVEESKWRFDVEL